jgi:hypothetical protein
VVIPKIYKKVLSDWVMVLGKEAAETISKECKFGTLIFGSVIFKQNFLFCIIAVLKFYKVKCRNNKNQSVLAFHSISFFVVLKI